MFSRSKLRRASKQIKGENDFIVDSDGDAIISVKAIGGEKLFSSYNFDGNEKLNSELSEFIYDKAKFTKAKQDIRIKIYTSEDVEPEEVQNAIRNNYKKDYIEFKNKHKRNLIFSAIMFIFGLFGMSLLFLMHKFFYNVYFDVVMEIATWVFIWEAIDSFFLRRASMRHNGLILLKLYAAEIDVINLKGMNSLTK